VRGIVFVVGGGGGGGGEVKVTLVQALRFCIGRTANRGSRGIALLNRHRGSEQAIRRIGGVEV